MKLRSLTLTIAGLALAAVSSAQFADQTLAVVLLDGNGSAPTAAGVQTRLANFAKTGTGQTPISTVLLPQFNSGTATSEGFLQSDGANPFNLYVGGYTAAVATGVAASSSASNPRVVTQFNALTGAITTTTLGANDFDANNIRSAVYVNNTLYAAGAGAAGSDFRLIQGTPGAAFGGTQDLTATPGATATLRVTHVQEGTVYASAAANIYSFSNGTQTSIFGTNPTGFTGAYDFRFADANTLYISDDTASGGLFRAVRNTGTGLFGTATRVGTIAGLRGLAFDGTTLYGTTPTGNQILSIDPATGATTILATAGTGQIFRGVEVVPEPATMAAMALGLGALAARRRKKSA